MVLDVGELTLADGNPVALVKKYLNQICTVHLKDAEFTDRKKKIEYRTICNGKYGEINCKSLEALAKAGYDGWVMIEPEDFRINPLAELADSIKYLKKGGFSITK